MNACTHQPPSLAHAVQFYESEEFLVDAATRFLGDGLRAGDGVVIVATRPHLDAMRARLEAFDLRAAVAAGRATLLDASETLSTIMVSGAPDPRRFDDRVGGVLHACTQAVKASGRAPRVHAFGEMVDLLWRDGRPAAAFRVEELWEAAARDHDLSILCAYGLKNFARTDDTAAFLDVCGRHGRVMPAEASDDAADAVLRDRAIDVLQQRTAALVAEVDKRRELEQALRHALAERRRAEHASRVRSELLAAVTQELRAPLKAIVGWSSLLRGAHAMSRADVREAADAIELHARAQGALLENISDAARVVGGTLAIHPKAVDVAFLVREAVEAVTSAAGAKRLSVAVNIQTDPCPTHADRRRLSQVFSNLLSNAVQFTPEGGRIEVRLCRSDEDILFSVRDSGCGISENVLPFVFDGLRRVDDALSTARRDHGLRLGLALTRHLVELHRGSIVAASPGPDRGATFTVRLPRRAAVRDA